MSELGNLAAFGFGHSVAGGRILVLTASIVINTKLPKKKEKKKSPLVVVNEYL